MSYDYDSVYLIASLIGAAVVGFVFGLVPLICGLIKKRVGLAIGGFAACLVGGFILGLILALPMCVLFTVLIFVTKPKNAGMPGAPYGQYPGQAPYQAPPQPMPGQPPVAGQQPVPPQPQTQQDPAAPEKMPWENPEQK